MDYFNKLIKDTLSYYDRYSTDRAHSSDHIKEVMNNVSKYYKYLSQDTRNKYSKDLLLLIALYHDIGLTINNDDKEWVRENHHELSYNKFLLDYKNGVFNNLQFINNSNYLVSANAILNHRSSHSLSTVSELDAFIRVCDGIVPIRDIVKRPLLYYRDHNPNMSNKDIGINASNYIINNLKLNSYPEWTPKFAKDIMNKNRSLAKSIVIRYKDNPEGLYNKFI
jgi:hypothetical protein